MGLFDFFRSRSEPKHEELKAQLANFLGDMEISKALKKAASLRELGRHQEANDEFQQALRYAHNLQSHSPTDPIPRVFEAMVFLEWERRDEAERCLATLLAQFGNKLDEPRRNVVQGLLQDLRRRRNLAEAAKGNSSEHFTQIYVCRTCGRLVNYITKPCPSCGCVQRTVEDMATAYLLSSVGLPFEAIIGIARRRKEGEALEKIIGNLSAMRAKVLADSPVRDQLERMVALGPDSNVSEGISLDAVRSCSQCGLDLISSYGTECQSCNEPVAIADLQRLCIALDSVLGLIEDRIDQTISKEFAELTCFLVWLRTRILEKQQGCDAKTASQAVRLIQSIGVLADKDGGGVVDFRDPAAPTIYLVKDRMHGDTEAYTKLLFMEFQRVLQHLRERAAS